MPELPPASSSHNDGGVQKTTIITLHACVLEHTRRLCDVIRLGPSSKSTIAEHVHEQSMPHEIDWQGMKAIDRARWKRERKIREKAFHIQKRKPQLNRDGVVERSAIWNAII